MKTLSILLILILTVCSKYGFGQNYNPDNVSKEVQTIVSEIAKENVLMGPAVGFAGRKPKQYERFEGLKKNATVPELIELTNHKNGVVRCYSFWELIHRDTIQSIDILKRHLNDNEFIRTLFGDLGFEEKVGDFFLSLVSPSQYGLEKKAILSEAGLKEINRILLDSDDNTLFAKDKLLMNSKPEDLNYEKCRNIFLKNKSNYALIALSKFRRSQDIDFIKEYLANEKMNYWGFLCVQYFPDPVFFQYLVDWHSKEIKKDSGFDYPKIRAFYKALVQFETIESHKMLERSIHETEGLCKSIHNKYIMVALLKYNRPYFGFIKSTLNVDKSDLVLLIWDKTEVEMD